jgi:DNA-binding transcriptional regulator YhcF (GntR family)
LTTEDLDTLRFQEQTMRLNLLRAGWLQFNVHYYDRIKFKYGYDDDASVQALAQLTEIAVESVPREVESYLFLNQIKPDPQAIKNEVQQIPLQLIQEFMTEKNEEVINTLKDQGITSEQVNKWIDKRTIVDWNIDTVKKIAVIIEGGEDISKSPNVPKKTTEDI